MSKSVKPRPRYGNFSIFQDGGRRHLGFLKFETFNGRTAEEGRSASPYQMWSKSVKTLPRYDYFSIFPRWRQSAVLDLFCECLDHPRRALGGLYHCVKFGWNRSSNVDNMQVLVFCDFSLKTPIHAPFGGVFRAQFPQKMSLIVLTPKRSAQGGETVTVSNCVEIGQTTAKIWRFFDFF